MVWKCLIYLILPFFPVSSNEVSTTELSGEVANMTCDVGWLHFRQKCYKVGGEADEEEKSWQDAADICTTYGGHLVSINSKVELNFLVDNIMKNLKKDAYIGLNDLESESTFSWLDGSPLNYTNFKVGEPNHRFPEEDCIRMLFKNQNSDKDVLGQWSDTICSDNHAYICQKKIVYADDGSWTTTSDEVDNESCDIGWHHFRQKCYKLGGIKTSWADADTICTRDGGHLVSVNSQEENDFLANNIMKPLEDAAWIGLNDRDWEFVYSWPDASPVNYTNFKTGEPDNRIPNADCIRMVPNNPNNGEIIGEWADYDCSANYLFICQKKAVNTNEILTTTGPDEVGNIPCDVGWHHFRKKCFKVGGLTSLTARSWRDAATTCTTYGGHLVSINSKVELDFLVNNTMMPLKKVVWIGLHNRDLNSTFYWHDGSPVNFTNWMNGQPSNKTINENCVEMISDLPKTEVIIGQWRKNQCSSTHAYICQKKVAPSSVKDESENLPNSKSVNTKKVLTTTRPDGYMPCGVGWLHFQQKCYKDGSTTHKGLKTWQEAENICTTYGGHLVSINSEEELDFLVNNILVNSMFPVWIGLHDQVLESILAWQDGSPVNYTNFMTEEPNHRYPDEDCVLMVYNNPNRDDVLGQWKDVRCSLYYSFICQKEVATDETEKLPNSTSGNLSLEAIIGIVIASILVLVLLGAGIYKFRSSNRSLSPNTSPQILHIQPFGEEEENFYEPLDYDKIDNPPCELGADTAIKLSQIPAHSFADRIHSTEDENYYEPME